MLACTGKDRTITFEADDDAQAAAVAKARGVFVSKMEQKPPGPLMEYAARSHNQTADSSGFTIDLGRLAAETSDRRAVWWTVTLIKIATIVVLSLLLLDAIRASGLTPPAAIASQQSDADRILSGLGAMSETNRASLYSILIVAVLLVPMPPKRG